MIIFNGFLKVARRASLICVSVLQFNAKHFLASFLSVAVHILGPTVKPSKASEGPIRRCKALYGVIRPYKAL